MKPYVYKRFVGNNFELLVTYKGIFTAEIPSSLPPSQIWTWFGNPSTFEDWYSHKLLLEESARTTCWILILAADDEVPPVFAWYRQVYHPTLLQVNDRLLFETYVNNWFIKNLSF